MTPPPSGLPRAFVNNLDYTSMDVIDDIAEGEWAVNDVRLDVRHRGT
jgi:hypothetical protein